MIDLLRGGQGVLNILPLAGVVEEIDSAVTDLQRRSAKVPTGRALSESLPAPSAGTGG